MAIPVQLHLKKDGLYAGQADSVEDFLVRYVVLPFEAKDGPQVSAFYRRVGTTTAVYNWIFVDRRSE